tara:strand:+ start:1077 stop:1295 length:219 start_codon:yes stop_codon:yes gene_type:complete
MIDELIELISEIIDTPKNQINENSGPESLPEWDSLAHLCIVAALEEKYNIKLEMNQIASIKNIKDIENLVKK